nr:cytochrome b/b6 domain-containing protein [Granulosicoccus sp.]
VLVLLQWMSADGMGRALKVLEQQETPAAWDFVLSNLHLFGGGLLLVLTVWRLRLRQTTALPVAVASRLLHSLGALTQWGLLLVLLVLPVSGAISYYQWHPSAGWWHEVAGWSLLGLLFLHLLGVFWHGLRGEALWRRMVTIGGRASKSVDSTSAQD